MLAARFADLLSRMLVDFLPTKVTPRGRHFHGCRSASSTDIHGAGLLRGRALFLADRGVSGAERRVGGHPGWNFVVCALGGAGGSRVSRLAADAPSEAGIGGKCGAR